ncbi:glycosyltransferase [Streptococcus sp. sy004]|uniref:glycosyltransferase family 2 protein n=1 Tax=Streptococcus sp. sy004 TaxID=2600149 RepID=UPI0011B84B15|nr:glycosyltransferase [Streptococcus sp. sy004]TWT12237.1 glycosyltransferase [Streptococcus sp. sy004]
MKTSPTLVSIICTVYNKAQWLEQTIDSFLGQNEVNYEILLVDDCSTDGSRVIIESYAKKYPELIRAFYHEENQGINQTWISICQEARGDYIARCDGDDYWIDDLKLAKQVQLLEHQAAKWCGTDINYIDENGRVLAQGVFEQGVVDLADTYEKMLVTRGFTAPSSWLIETQVMRQANQMLLEDKDTADDTFNLQLDLFNLTEFVFLPEVTVAYRVNQGSDSRPKTFKQLQQRFDRLLQTQYYYLDKYPKRDTVAMLKLLLDRHNEFSLALAQKDYPVSHLSTQEISISYIKKEASDANQILSTTMSYQDTLTFTLPDDAITLRIDLSKLPSFYRYIRVIDDSYQTELLPNFTNGVRFQETYFFNQGNAYLYYDVGHLPQKQFSLSYQMYNVDDVAEDDYIVKLLSSDLLTYQELKQNLDNSQRQLLMLESEKQYYKKELEQMVVRYNSVVHSRRWRIPTKLINFFRRK